MSLENTLRLLMTPDGYSPVIRYNIWDVQNDRPMFDYALDYWGMVRGIAALGELGAPLHESLACLEPREAVLADLVTSTKFHEGQWTVASFVDRYLRPVYNDGVVVENHVIPVMLERPSLPQGQLAMHHDFQCMVSSGLRGWDFCHEGYDSEKDPQTLSSVALHNRRSGQVVHLELRPKPLTQPQDLWWIMRDHNQANLWLVRPFGPGYVYDEDVPPLHLITGERKGVKFGVLAYGPYRGLPDPRTCRQIERLALGTLGHYMSHMSCTAFNSEAD